MIRIISTLLFAISLTACNQQESDPFKSCDNFNQLASKMEIVIGEIKNKYEGETQFLKRLDNAQVYWLQYKERHMKMLYPEGYDVTRKKYGREVFNPCKCKELERLFDLRVDELKTFLNGPRKGQEECPTFNNIKEG